MQEAKKKAVRKAWSALQDAKLIGPDVSVPPTSAIVLPEQLPLCKLPQQQPLEYLGINKLYNSDSNIVWPDQCVFVRVEITPPQSTWADLGFIYAPTEPSEHVTSAMRFQLDDRMVWLEPSLLKWSGQPSQPMQRSQFSLVSSTNSAKPASSVRAFNQHSTPQARRGMF